MNKNNNAYEDEGLQLRLIQDFRSERVKLKELEEVHVKMEKTILGMSNLTLSDLTEEKIQAMSIAGEGILETEKHIRSKQAKIIDLLCLIVKSADIELEVPTSTKQDVIN